MFDFYSKFLYYFSILGRNQLSMVDHRAEEGKFERDNEAVQKYINIGLDRKFTVKKIQLTLGGKRYCKSSLGSVKATFTPFSYQQRQTLL
jgi:hypothetical protein